MIDLWIIRHGETEENIKGICQGQTPGTLTADGLKQAQQAGEALKEVKFDTIYSSDLLRTMISAQAVAQPQGEQEIVPNKLLRERYLADWQGKPFPKDWNWEDSQLPQGAESYEDLIVRVQQFLAKVQAENKGESVLAMSHGGLIRAFWTVLESQAPESYYQWDAPKNTSISRYQIADDGTIRPVFRNNVDHLNGAEQKNNSAWQL